MNNTLSIEELKTIVRHLQMVKNIMGNHNEMNFDDWQKIYIGSELLQDTVLCWLYDKQENQKMAV